MLISPQRANGIWLRHGNGEVTAPPKANIPSHHINGA
jgi:hypothetical protein